MSKFLRGLLVRGIGRGNDTIIGIEMDTRYETEQFYNQDGVVEEVGLIDEMEIIYGHRHEGSIEIGDIVKVSWIALSKGFEVDDGLWWVMLEDVIGVYDGEELEPINGNVFFRREAKDRGIVVRVSDGCGVDVGDYIECRGAFVIESPYKEEEEISYVFKDNIKIAYKRN